MKDKPKKEKPVQVGPKMVARMLVVDLTPIVEPPEMHIVNVKARTERFKARQNAAKNRVRTVIQEFRQELRRAFSTFSLAQMAGAAVERYEFVNDEDDTDEHNPPPAKFNYRVIPNSERAKAILSNATGQEPGKMNAYELRQDILARNPHWYSRQWDSLRAELDKAWKAKDQEFTNTNRGFLVLNGRRGTNRFMNVGISFPRKVLPNGRYGINHISHLANGYSLRINLDHHGSMDFRVADLRSRRAQIWRCVRDGVDGYIPGSATLNIVERVIDGVRVDQIVLQMTYWRLADTQNLDPARTLYVAFHPEPSDESFLFSLTTEDGNYDEYMAAAVLAMLRQHASKSKAITDRRRACGSPRQPWGHRKGWLKNQHHLSRITRNFANRKSDFNRCFARLIADRAKQWNCGTVRITHPEKLYGNPWGWFDLKQIMVAHADDRGFNLFFADQQKPAYEVEVSTPPNPSAETPAAS